jgi:prolyl-tRNA synthetase
MPNGRILENGSVNHLGQAYAKKFDIKFIDEDKGGTHYVWQICTGNGARYLAAAIAQHSDKFGLVIPPKIAPYPVIITLIMRSGADINEKLIAKGKDLVNRFKKIGMKARLDDSDDRPGEKFYESELKGYPVRIEIGAKEFKSGSYSVFRRDLKQREEVLDDQLETSITELLDEIQSNLHDKAVEYYKKQQKYTMDLKEAVSHINDGYATQVPYCAQSSCWYELKEQGDGFELVGTLTEEAKSEVPCIICQTKTKFIGLYGHSY